MIRFRKAEGRIWVVFGPQSELPGPGTYPVTKKDGSTTHAIVERISKPFLVDGTPHVYGFLRQRHSGGCACEDQGCCRPRCWCERHCVCRGGTIFDCMG